MYEINGQYSYDMELFFKVDDIRDLYRFDKG